MDSILLGGKVAVLYLVVLLKLLLTYGIEVVSADVTEDVICSVLLADYGVALDFEVSLNISYEQPELFRLRHSLDSILQCCVDDFRSKQVYSGSQDRHSHHRNPDELIAEEQCRP